MQRNAWLYALDYSMLANQQAIHSVRCHHQPAMELFVKNLRFHSFHGVTSEERTVGQRIRASIRAQVSTSAGTTDSLQDSIDYVGLARLAVEVSRESHAHTLEHFAHRLCHAAFEKWSRLESIEVELEKVNPPIELEVESVGVRLSLDRESLGA